MAEADPAPDPRIEYGAGSSSGTSQDDMTGGPGYLIVMALLSSAGPWLLDYGVSVLESHRA